VLAPVERVDEFIGKMKRGDVHFIGAAAK